MSQPFFPYKTVIGFSGLVSALMLAVGILMGQWMNAGDNAPIANQPLQPLQLNASASSAGKNVSLATGQIDGDYEGLFILDHLNGNLQCWILNIRTSTVGGIYRTNVLPALGGGKAGGEFDFVMTTGFFNFNNRGATKPAQCICYVAEGNSGMAAGFSFTYEKGEIQRGNVVAGELQVVCQGPIRDVQVREQ